MRYKEGCLDRTQVMLFGLSVDASIPADSDVRIVDEAMDLMDLSCLEAGYSSVGCPAYSPVMLAKILVYGYSKGIRSSRALEESVSNDKRFIWLCSGLAPDHSTISRFRKSKSSDLKCVFGQTVRVCTDAGLVLLNVTATDGSKFGARASKRSLYDARRLERESELIDKIFEEAEEIDALEDEMYGSSSGREVPCELADAAKRRERIAEIAKCVEAQQRKVSSSDQECRVMRTTSGLCPAYNTQITVDGANQVVVACDVTCDANDSAALGDQLEQVVENTGLRADVVLADGGYSSEETFKILESTGQEALIPPKEQPQEKGRKDLFASKCFARDEGRDVLICPAGRELRFYQELRCSSGTYREYRGFDCRSCSFFGQCVSDQRKTGRAIQISVVASKRQQMIDKLKTDEGRQLYALRQQIVEPVFGNIKSNMRLGRLGLHGLSGARAEMWLVFAAHNLMVYARAVRSHLLFCQCLLRSAFQSSPCGWKHQQFAAELLSTVS